MANVQIYRFQFLQNNPFGSFVAGDVLDIFLETDDAIVPAGPFEFQGAGITVLKNGVNYPVAGSGMILDFSPTIVTVQSFNPQICVGTSLLVFSLYGPWPYATYYSLEDHYSCVVNPPTCDLIVVGVPIVVPATDGVTADGSIQINGSSSNPIEYSIGADFVYGSGQTEGAFSTLLPGQYRIYLRDSANCAVNILVDVPVNNIYGPKYRLEYTDNQEIITRLDISMRGYSGTIFDTADLVKGTGSPFQIQLRGEGSEDKFEALMSSQGNLNLTSVTDLQYLELYTNDPNLYRIEYSKKFSESATVSVSLPALSTWLTESTSGAKPDWTVGISTPNVTLAGTGPFSSKTSENLYTDFAFVAGNAYSLSLTYTRLTNSGSSNPRTATLAVTDSSSAAIFSISSSAVEGSNTIDLSFVATSDCDRIVFRYGSGMNVTITVNSISATTNGYQILWIGKVLPMQYSEEYKAPPYYVSVVATDGLAELKNYFLIQPDGQKYYGTTSLIKLVAYCLRFLKLGLNIRVACNLYAIDMDQADEDDPFDQAYVDYECFYLAEKEPNLEFVLAKILEPFGCRITLWEGRWNIVRVEEMTGDYDYREFDASGEYISNGTFSPVIDCLYPSASIGEVELDAELDTELGFDLGVILARADHNLEIKPGYGRIKAIYRLGLKPNILSNGDFRLKSIYYAPDNIYLFDLNKDGWTLVNAGYVLTEGYEFINENNIAYTISSGEDTLSGTTGGEAYLQSGTYSVKMGTNNQLKITVRCKVSRVNITVGTTVYTVDVPYVKIRFRVKYGSLYLQANGTWGSAENILTFYCTEFNKFADYEILATQPTSGTPVNGMDLDVRVYHAYAYHADFFNIADLKAFPTWDGVSAQTVPTGYRTELRDSGGIFFGTMYYYELEESSAPDDGFNVVEPDDTNGSNERRWILKTKKVGSGVVNGANVFPFAIDKVTIAYLTDGKDPIDAIVRTVNGESNNQLVFEKAFIIGSYSNLIVTEVNFGIDLGIFFPSGGLALTTTNTLSADLIYTGYLRDVNGVGYEFWARDGVAESDKLHGILLRAYALQYKRSWRLLRGSIYANVYFGLLNVVRNVNDNGRIYLPIGLTLDDKMCTWSGEFLEIGATGGGSDGSGSSPFSSGFTVGFGSSGFN